MEPLFENLMDLKLGWQNDLSIFSIILLFEGRGACAYYQDQTYGAERIAELDRLNGE